MLQSLRERLPGEDFLYFADTRYLPYGDRPESFLRERSLHIAQGLAARGAKALVIACNTATAAAVEVIRDTLHLPVVAVEPAVKPAAAASRSGEIAVLATRRTVESARLQRLIATHAPQQRVHAIACPGLAEAIEAHGPESAAVGAILDEVLAPLAATQVDVVALGCTHYPWAAAAIAHRLPAGVQLMDTGPAVARQLDRLLRAGNALGGGNGRLVLASSAAPMQVRATLDRLWPVHQPVEHWEP